MMTWVSASLDQTVGLGRRLGQLAEAGDVIALDGELGAGKTQFVRGLAMGMGLDPAAVSSPTFVIMHEYTAEPAADDAVPLVHIDAYRLTGPDDLASVGFDEELRDGAVLAIEWAARLDDFPGGGEVLGRDRLHLLLEHDGEESRHVTLTPHGRWAALLTTLNL